MNDGDRKQHWPWATLLLAISIGYGCAGSDSSGKMREGSVNDLLTGNSTNISSLESQSLMVENMATDLEPQKDEYRIGANDVLNISVLGHTEVSSEQDSTRIMGTVVKKDGAIYMPIIGVIPVAGHTIEEFHHILRERLATYIKDPQFTVDVLKYQSQKFYILGLVNAPGAFAVDGDTTLLEGIGMAKGVKAEGSLERAYVIRNQSLLPINLADVLLRGDTSRNIFMRDGDLVYVPSSEDQKVYVFGEVKDPKAVPLPRGRLSLAHALAEAGGILSVEADKGCIKLIRGSWQDPVVYTLSYDTVLAQGESIYLKAGDRIVVQATTLTTASRYMQQILPFLIGADTVSRTVDRHTPQ